MTLDRRDAEYRQNRDDQKWRMDQLWLSGAIMDNTYLRSLFIYGYDAAEANEQLWLLKQVKANRMKPLSKA